MIVIAVSAALASALGFAVSTSLQHRAASATANGEPGTKALFAALARRPSWHLSLLLGALAFGMHAVAVGHGPLVIVQPLVVTGIVFALPVRAALDRQYPAVRDVAWVAVTTAGIAFFVVSSDPATAAGGPRLDKAIPFIVVGTVVTAALSLIGFRAATPRRRALLLGSASGVLFGLTAGVLKFTVLHASLRPLGVTALAVLLALGSWGFALNQRTYQVAPLAISMPVLNVVVVVVATAVGFSVFREVPAHQPAALAAEAIGLVLMAWGLMKLSRLEVGQTVRRSVPARAGQVEASGGNA